LADLRMGLPSSATLLFRKRIVGFVKEFAGAKG